MKPKSLIRVLIVDDEAPIREVLKATLQDEGYQVLTAQDGQEGLQLMSQFTPHIVFLDIWMPGRLDGIEVLNQAKKQFPETEFLMISGHGTIETAVKATRMGAWDFIEKPLSMDRILINLGNIQQFQSERAQKQSLLTQFRKNLAIIGDARTTTQLKEWISYSGPQDQSLLLKGEMGSGRRLVAQNIHFASPRAGLPFIEVNAANIPIDLFDYEFFGWSNSILPGQVSEQKGKIELADGGTLYISEAHLLPISTQKKLAYFVRTNQFRRAGSQTLIESRTRLMFCLTLPQDELDAELMGLLPNQYRIPTLRERIDDLLALFWYFSDTIVREEGVARKVLHADAVALLKSYQWPGNLRELRNFIERLYLLTPAEQIEVHDLHFAGLPSDNGSPFYQVNFRQARAQFEKQFLLEKLKEYEGNISRTAEAIGLERSYLHRKLKIYGIESN